MTEATRKTVAADGTVRGLKRARESVVAPVERPFRFSVLTWNVWKKGGIEVHDWERRKPVLQSVARHFQPDIICLQEASEESIGAIMEALPHHKRVLGDGPCWATEGSILYDGRLFSADGNGAELVGMEYEALEGGRPERRLLWARLVCICDGRSFLVSTAHLTWQGSCGNVGIGIEPMENGGPNPRIAQAAACATQLDRLAGPPDGRLPCLLMGDFNEGFVIQRPLEAAGFVDCLPLNSSPSPTPTPRERGPGSFATWNPKVHRSPGLS